MAAKTVRRINFNVSQEIYDRLQELAQAKGTTISSVLRDAIALEGWFEETRREGGRILVEHGGKAREIVRR